MKLALMLIFTSHLLITFSCVTQESPYLTIQDEKARSIIEKSIDAYGGLENWNNIDNFSFEKHYTLFDSIGNEEVTVYQKHHYTPQEIRITWMEGQDKIILSKKGDHYEKLRNNELDKTAILQKEKNSILASTFVMSFPYNLLDRGNRVVYEGQTIFEGEAVDIIKAEYFPESQEHQTENDIWWHYIDQESHLRLGYRVKHSDHISLVKNNDFHVVEGFTLPWKRESYRIDKNGNELYLRASYEYLAYSVVQ